MKSSSYYVAPLRSRKAIVAWLIDRATRENRRASYGMFTYDVKLGRLDLSFDHLAKVGRESDSLDVDASPRYLDACREICEAKQERLYENAVEQARESVIEHVGNRMLWNGDDVEIAEWEFAGRSGGWLCLKTFDGVNLGAFGAADLFSEEGPDSGGPVSYDWLRNLYRFLIQCDHDFKRPETEVEYLAAYSLFNHLCDHIETDKQATERETRANAEQAERVYWEARDMVTV